VFREPTDTERWAFVRAQIFAPKTNHSELLAQVGRFRQEVRLWCEDELLAQWGEAVIDKDASAPEWLAKAAILGDALRQIGGEREVADAVEAIRHAATPSVVMRLARGHAAYGAGRRADSKSEAANELREMDAAVAALTPDVTPFAWRARAEHAGAVYLSNNYARALDELQRMPAGNDASFSSSCRGKIEALIGIIQLQTGSY